MAAPVPVVVLDFGAQYNHLIARRIREAHVFCEVLPGDASYETVIERRPRALVLSGGPSSVADPHAPHMDRRLLEAGVPVLGICYGMQLMTHLLGGRVEPGAFREYGATQLHQVGASPLLDGIPDPATVWMSHGDLVAEVPPGFRVFAKTSETPAAVMGDPERGLWGVQYHPEVRHTPQGVTMLSNFLTRVAGIEPGWYPEDFVTEAVANLQTRVGDGAEALIGLSGGVDSAVAAKLAEMAIGRRLHAILVDHGLMRQGEVEEVMAAFPSLDLRVVDAHDAFFSALTGVTDPEAKRKIVGREFIRAFEREAERLGHPSVLIQGTVYPDVIESGTTHAATIKSHHNVGGLPDDVEFQVVEPLRWLFKDEVRQVGERLGMPPALVWRQPFPGPGLAVRIMGEVTPAKAEVLRQCDAIVRQELRDAGLDREIWQAFAVLTGAKAVGVMGDQRTYGEVVAIRAVTSDDGMTADWARIPHDLLERMAHRMIGEVSGVTRVVYDITSKPPGTIEWE